MERRSNNSFIVRKTVIRCIIEHFIQGKTMNHPPGSLEEIVENLVKTWEMEASHKINFSQVIRNSLRLC